VAVAPPAFPAAAAPARAWLAVVQWAFLGALLAVLYAPVVWDLAALWRGEAAYSHGPLIPLIAAYMVWQTRQRLREVPRRPCPAAWPLLLAGLLLLLVGRLAYEIHLAALSVILVLGALVAMAGGPRLLWAAVVPIAYLVFMIPLPWTVYFGAGDPLKITTAVVATEVVAPLRIPMLREGTLIYLPTVTLEVESACSGVRTVLSLLPLAVAFAYLMVRRPWGRAVLIASAVPIAVLANILRVAEIIVQAHFFPDNVTGYALHLYSAWIPMLFGLPMLFGVGGLIQWWERRESSGSRS
jgi:exosortase